MNEPQTITVAGVTFKADDVISAVVKIDGRKIEIKEKEQEPAKLGFVPVTPEIKP